MCGMWLEDHSLGMPGILSILKWALPLPRRFAKLCWASKVLGYSDCIRATRPLPVLQPLPHDARNKTAVSSNYLPEHIPPLYAKFSLLPIIALTQEWPCVNRILRICKYSTTLSQGHTLFESPMWHTYNLWRFNTADTKACLWLRSWASFILLPPW
jgi:hypothetical protein